MSDEDLCYMSAEEALVRFRAREISPVEVMQAQIARAEATKDTVNAFSYTFFEEAMDRARAAEAVYMSRSRDPRPLEGLSVAIKDENELEGKPMSMGSRILEGTIGQTNVPINQRLLDAGAIAHARSTTSEFACAAVGWTDLWGVTRNPWNLEFTTAGSSTGSAASLAAGTTTLATGSDIGGSIRIPASTCGLAGFKPSYGRNPVEGPGNLVFAIHVGPLARTVGDAALFQNVVCGPHDADPAALRPKLDFPATYPSVKGWKIAYSPNLGCYEIDHEVRAHTETALDHLRAQGAEVIEVDLGWSMDDIEGMAVAILFTMASEMELVCKGNEHLMTSYARKVFEDAQHYSGGELLQSYNVINGMYRKFTSAMGGCDVMVTPTTGLPSIPAEFDQTREGLQINGKDVDPVLGWILTPAFNALSRNPVMTVPTGQASSGVPTGMQIIGKTYCDLDVFRAAYALEQAAGRWFGPGRRPAI